jgi:hypothetical protein
LTWVLSVENLQVTIPIYANWTPENIYENIKLFRSQMKWKNFKFTYDAERFETKGYFVVHLSYGEPEKKLSILIYRDKVQLNYKSWEGAVVASTALTYLLSDEGRNIFLDSLYSEFKATGRFNLQFQEFCLHILISQYLDLVNGKVPKELIPNVKNMVISQLELMKTNLE